MDESSPAPAAPAGREALLLSGAEHRPGAVSYTHLPTNVGVDAAILMNPQVWVATGHVGGFSDPLMDCKDCKTRHRADKLIEDFTGESADGWSNEKMMDFIKEHHIQCPNCGSENFTEIRQFNLMFKTFQGVTEDQKNEIYLRPETAQGIFVNFPSVCLLYTSIFALYHSFPEISNKNADKKGEKPVFFRQGRQGNPFWGIFFQNLQENSFFARSCPRTFPHCRPLQPPFPRGNVENSVETVKNPCPHAGFHFPPFSQWLSFM